jgi:hypothetical protein
MFFADETMFISECIIWINSNPFDSGKITKNLFNVYVIILDHMKIGLYILLLKMSYFLVLIRWIRSPIAKKIHRFCSDFLHLYFRKKLIDCWYSFAKEINDFFGRNYSR